MNASGYDHILFTFQPYQHFFCLNLYFFPFLKPFLLSRSKHGKKRIFARLHRSLLSPQLRKRAYKIYNPIYMVQIELSVFCYILPIFGHKESSCLLWYSSNNIKLFYCNPPVYRYNCPLHHETKEYIKFYFDVNFVFDLFCSKVASSEVNSKNHGRNILWENLPSYFEQGLLGFMFSFRCYMYF